MKYLSYNFECIHIKGGWCQIFHEPGCYMECEHKKCESCKNRKTPARKEPRRGCFIGKKNE